MEQYTYRNYHPGSYPVCDALNFEIFLSFLIKPLSYMTKRSEQKLQYLKNEKSF